MRKAIQFFVAAAALHVEAVKVEVDTRKKIDVDTTTANKKTLVADKTNTKGKDGGCCGEEEVMCKDIAKGDRAKCDEGQEWYNGGKMPKHDEGDTDKHKKYCCRKSTSFMCC